MPAMMILILPYNLTFQNLVKFILIPVILLVNLGAKVYAIISPVLIYQLWPVQGKTITGELIGNQILHFSPKVYSATSNSNSV